MPLESCVICLDNSEWMRNSDYSPTRISAQYDLVSMLVSAKLRDNPESTVGLLTTAGNNGVDVLASPTLDQGKLLSALHGIRLSGACKLTAGVQVAMLALKHRQNKKGSQRVLLIVGSPVQNEEKQLVKIGKQLKKNNVALDVIMMGENETNNDKMQKFVDAANKNDNSRIVVVPAGMRASDVVRQSVLVRNNVGGSGTTGGAAGGGAGGNFEEYGGVDPSLDPELAMVLRLSMSEARENAERQQPAVENSPGGTGGDAPPAAPQAAAGGNTGGAADADDDEDMSEEDMLLQQALAMSMAAAQTGDDSSTAAAAPAAATTPAPAAAEQPTGSQAAAEESPGGDANAEAGTSGAGEAAFQDPSFVTNLLNSLPGVDVSDPAIQAALASMNSAADAASSDADKDKDKDKNKE